MRFLGFFGLGAFFLYLTVATLIGNLEIVGKAGIAIYHFQTDFFGLLGYFYILPLFYFLYTFYRFPEKHIDHLGNLTLYFLGFISALIFQALISSSGWRGIFGGAIVDFLTPFIGTVGVWLIWLFSCLTVMLGIMETHRWKALFYHFYTTLIRLPIQKNSTIPDPEEHLSPEEQCVTIALETSSTFTHIKTIEKEIKEEEQIELNEPIVAKQVEEEYRLEPTIKVIPNHVPPTSRFRDTKEEKSTKNTLDVLQQPLIIPPVLLEETLPSQTSTFNSESTLTQSHDDKLSYQSKSIPIFNEPEICSTHDLSSLNHTNPIQVEEIPFVPLVKEVEENSKLLAEIEKGKQHAPKNFILPSVNFLAFSNTPKKEVNEAEIDAKIKDLLEKLSRFKIEGDVVRTYSGPIVTTFEFKPAPHIKVSRILQLQDDIAMALRAQTIRIQAPVPGKDVVGIEIPNHSTQTIYLREILESSLFQQAASPLTLALGKDIVGNSFITDLKKLPHLLIAGTTGSGKSVGINAMILSLLYRNSPDDLRLLMIDPKMLEFSIYNDIPHLLTPVITKPKQAVAALANMVKEMEDRYYKMSKTKTKNIDNYNEKAQREGFSPMPFIVVIIDELADLMMTSGKDVELSIARLAQMARAAGIHLIVATQRPSVDVVTGLIKANLPSRISFRVGQKIDSKVIIDQMGAESLLGKGDMLFTPPGSVGLVRLHAPWSSEDEIDKICEFIKSQREPNYDHSFLDEESNESLNRSDLSDDLDEMYEEAKHIVLTERKTSISYIQRRLQIGYNRAARIVEQLEATGVLSQANTKGLREVL